MLSYNKILLICNSDIGRKGTIGFRFTKIAEFLKDRDIPITIVARANYTKKLEVIVPLYKNILSRALNALRICLFPSFNHRKFDVYFFEKFSLNVLKRNKKNFLLAHFGEYAPKTISYLKKKGVKIILDIPIAHPVYASYLSGHGFILDENIKNTPSFLEKSLALADLLIVPSEFVKQTLEMADIKKPTEIIPFGVDIPNNFSEKDIKQKQFNPLRFIFAGNVNRRKGVNFLLEAWDKMCLKNAELLICGRVHKSMQKELRKYKLKNVKFYGYVKINEYLKRSNVFVFPSLFEGSAKVVYEAMAYGLPVITTPNSGSIIKNGESGFIVPIGDVKILIEKMLYFYYYPEKIVEMGTKALNQVRHYSWKRYAKSVTDIYKKFI